MVEVEIMQGKHNVAWKGYSNPNDARKLKMMAECMGASMTN